MLVQQVHDANARESLPEPVDAANALLDAHGVPRHVVIDDGAAELEVEAFGGGVRAKKDVRIALSENPFHFIPWDGPPCSRPVASLSAPSGKTHDPLAGRGDMVTQEIERIGELREHHDLLVAVMREDGTFHEFARVGGGFTEEDRKTLAAELRKRIVPSDYVAVNNDYVAYEMIEPGPVIEMSCLDLVSENSKGAPVKRMVLDWTGERFLPLSRMPLVSVISPQFVRIREDKEANVEDVNIRQVTNLVRVADTEEPARAGRVDDRHGEQQRSRPCGDAPEDFAHRSSGLLL